MNAIGIELIVDDLDRAIELFVDVLGCALVARGAATLVAGEIATIDAGNMIVNLLVPAAAGPGAMLSNREARLSQLIFGVEAGDEIRRAFDRTVAAGLSVTTTDDGRFIVLPDTVQGALGIGVALVAVPLDGDAAPDAGTAR